MDDIIENTKVRYHANQLVRTLNKIVMLMIKTPNCELERDQEKEKLIELGQRHYHYGIKKEHFKIFENCFIQSLEESLQVETFQEKLENPWRKLIHFLFKQYTDGMNFEKKEEIKS